MPSPTTLRKDSRGAQATHKPLLTDGFFLFEQMPSGAYCENAQVFNDKSECKNGNTLGVIQALEVFRPPRDE